VIVEIKRAACSLNPSAVMRFLWRPSVGERPSIQAVNDRARRVADFRQEAVGA